MKLTIKSNLPDHSISHFVHSFWMLENKSGKDIPSTVLPNGMVDITLLKMNSQKEELLVRGIETLPRQVTIMAGTTIFTIGLKLLAVEYLLGDSIKNVLNEGRTLTNDLWKFEQADFNNFENFCNKSTQKIKTILIESIDSRKLKLFELIYSSHGSMTVKELSEKVYWSSRQINRYFNQQFGISLKAYCNILRFGASFKHISEGQLFPQESFTDQNHFIKQIRKYAGVTPKELSKNKDDQFIDMVAIGKLPS
jgi:AraC-like DNA-binding protein